MGAASVAAGTPECSLATLGSFDLRIRGQSIPHPSTQKARALLAYLILHRRTDVPRERLIEIFWPEAEPERARDSLNTALHSIRRGLRTSQFDPDEYIFANKSIIRWELPVDLDVEAIEQALQHEDDETAASEALARYRGDFLEGDYDDWTATERERISEHYERLLARTVRSTKEPQAAKRLLARNPYDENAYAALVDAELAAGRYFSAAQIARQCVTALKEVGAAPSAQFAQRLSEIERHSVQTSTLPEVPFVGRDAEVAELLEIAQRVRPDVPRIALIEGEPGIGKSALVDRVAQQAAARGDRVLTLRAISGDTRPFGMWPSLYESLDGPDFATFLALTPSDAAAALGATIVERLPAPAIIAVDDAQYLSSDALETLTSLSKTASAAKSHVVLISVRPEGFGPLSERLHDVPHAVVHLQTLTPQDLETAIALAGVDLDPEICALLSDRAQGHPLYFKGLLEQLARSGSLRREGGRWQLADAEPDLELSPSLRRLIENRIRARGSDGVAVAAALALEPSASSTELGRALDMPELRVLDALDDLLAYHIITEPSSGTRQFAFTHDLLEETARTLLPSARRTRLHRDFARILSESALRGRDMRRAIHLQAAGMFAEAAEAYIAAAQDSVDAQAPHAILERTDAGLACLNQLSDSAQFDLLYSRLYQARSFAYRLQWQTDTCTDEAHKSVEHARRSGDLRCLSEALQVLRSAINVGIMDCEQQLQIAREQAEIGEQLGDVALTVQSLIDAGHSYRIIFDLDSAEPWLRRAFAVAKNSGAHDLIAKAAIQLLSLQVCWWRFEGASEAIAALRAQETQTDWPLRAHSALTLSLVFGELARYRNAQIQLDAVEGILNTAMLRRSTRFQFVPRPEIAIRFDYFRASLDSRRENWDEGLERFGHYLPMYESLLTEQRYRDLFTLARIDLLLGRNAPGDAARAAELLQTVDSSWDPETGFEPSHAPLVITARLGARNGSTDASALLTHALEFLDTERLRWPYGSDRAYARILDSAKEIGDERAANRAATSYESARNQRLAASRDLVSI